jgi:hypothetical protein
MGVRQGIRLLLASAALLIVAAGPAAAQGTASAGRFIVVTGDVRVLGDDGIARVAVRNGALRQGESIVTGPNSLAQLHMTDGGAVSVRADTQLKLDAYRYSGSDDRNGSFFVSILKGGFRTITGLIARHNRNNYRVSTTSATMGVRGTDFEVVHVLQPVADAAAGTYNRVYEGITSVQNRAGALVLVNREQTAFVALPSNLPPVLVAPPASIFGKPTPVPRLNPQSRREADGQADGGAPAERVAKDAPAAKESVPARAVAPGRALTAPLLNPIDSPRVLEMAPTLQTSPTTTTISPTLISPTTTTISPTLISPTTTTISPTTTTISPTLISPTTTTISPTLISPTTTTISPTLISPTTTTISPTLISPTTTTISPTLISPTTTTISPTTTTIKR